MIGCNLWILKCESSLLSDTVSVLFLSLSVCVYCIHVYIMTCAFLYFDTVCTCKIKCTSKCLSQKSLFSAIVQSFSSASWKVSSLTSPSDTCVIVRRGYCPVKSPTYRSPQNGLCWRSQSAWGVSVLASLPSLISGGKYDKSSGMLPWPIEQEERGNNNCNKYMK